MKLRTKNTAAFTLIELLVVITIIGVLAGLAVPAISGALDKAKQAADTSNARQLGIILFGVANDENGIYPIGPTNDSGVRTNASSSSDLFEGMIEDGELTDPKILATTNTTPYQGSLSSPDLNPGGQVNVGWDYTRGLTTTDPANVPLLMSAGAVENISDIAAEITLPNTHVWRQKGLIVYYVGNSAEWVKARSGGTVNSLIDSSDSDMIPVAANLIPNTSD